MKSAASASTRTTPISLLRSGLSAASRGLLRGAGRTLLVIAAAWVPIGALAQAQDYPNRPIKLIVPFPPGGATDTQLRALAIAASKHLGQPIVVENRPGASGTIGPAMVATAAPDGYTLTQLHTGVFRQPHMARTSFDPRTDFTYIMGISAYTFGVVVRADAPWKTFREYMDYAKANPGKLTYVTHSVGSPMFFVMETLAEKQGVQFLHVATKGNAENNSLLLGGHVMSSADGAAWAPYVNSGQFRLLVTWGEKRTRQWPNVPTLLELGYGIAESTPYGIGGPKGMDPKVVQIIHDAFRKGMSDPEHVKVLNLLNQEALDMGPAEFEKFANESYVRQKALVEKFGLGRKD